MEYISTFDLPKLSASILFVTRISLQRIHFKLILIIPLKSISRGTKCLAYLRVSNANLICILILYVQCTLYNVQCTPYMTMLQALADAAGCATILSSRTYTSIKNISYIDNL